MKQLKEELTRLKQELADKEWASQKTNEGIRILYKELEEKGAALREAYGKVERIVEERTAQLKQAEKLASETAWQLKGVIQSVCDGITLSDANGHMEIFNSRMHEITGYTIDEANASGDLSALIYPDSQERQKALESLKEVMQKGRYHEVETTIQAKDGSKKTLLVSTTLIGCKDRDMFLSVYRDITERKRAAEELRRTYEELQTAHRRLKESQAQLIQTEKMSALGTLVAGTAHELNNPIMGILNFVAHCVKHTSEDAPIYTVLQDIQHEAKRCAEIVRNLLTFSHVKRDDDEAYQKGSLTEILGRVLRLLCYRIEKQGVSVTQHIADDTPEIWMDPNNVQRLILNLIANALDALEDSPIRELNVEIRREGEFVQMTIADTGCGIAAEHLGSIFDPFFTTKPVGQGTGLGLSVCQGIVETHGGKITCESEPGVGAKFTILLPVEKAGKEQIKCASAYL